LKWYDGGGENGITSKKVFLKLKCFSLIRILTFPLFIETIRAFLFLSFFSLFSMLNLLRTWGVLMIFEEKIASSKNSFQMA
jgi:hypothetical protein